jgi:hypothetical protein
MYPILEYSSTYLILEYYAYFHIYTLCIYPVFVLPIYMHILTVSVYTILIHADSFNTLLIENRTTHSICDGLDTKGDSSAFSQIVFLLQRKGPLFFSKPVNVDLKNACAENPPAKERQNMWNRRRRSFCATSRNFGSLLRRAPRTSALQAINHEKKFTVRRALFRRESMPLWMRGCMAKTGIK